MSCVRLCRKEAKRHKQTALPEKEIKEEREGDGPVHHRTKAWRTAATPRRVLDTWKRPRAPLMAEVGVIPSSEFVPVAAPVATEAAGATVAVAMPDIVVGAKPDTLAPTPVDVTLNCPD